MTLPGKDTMDQATLRQAEEDAALEAWDRSREAARFYKARIIDMRVVVEAASEGADTPAAAVERLHEAWSVLRWTRTADLRYTEEVVEVIEGWCP